MHSRRGVICPLSAGVHGGGRDVPGRRNQGDQSDQGPQAAPHAPIARIKKNPSCALIYRPDPHHDLHLVFISEKEPQHSPASTSYLQRGRCLEYK